LQQAVRPASSEWPVFPTLHRPTLSRTARAALADAGYDSEEVEATIDEYDWLALYREHEFVPSALTTNGGRTVMRRVCDEAEIDLDGEHDYLTPHGGRRGAGDVLYREDPVLAQTALRHRSIETTKDSYSYIEAGETASRAGDIFDADRDDE
jgi:integrase